MRAVTSLLRLLAAAQVPGIRDTLSGLALLLLAAGVGLIAFTFALLAAFWALSSVLPQWQAALAIAGIALLAALILRLAAVRLIRRRTPVQGLLGFKPGATLPQASVPAAQAKAPVEPLTLVLVAALAGIALGRRLSK
jgi:hypothetical protein